MSDTTNTNPESSKGPLAAAIRTACLLEATARKPGNVHPEASFHDLNWLDFVRSAVAIAPPLSRAGDRGVGPAVFDAVQANVEAVGRNTNLGIILLIAPLAAVPSGVRLEEGIGDILAGLTCEDAAWAYRAIRAARPGGMGAVDREDVASEPTVTLLEAMAMAAGRDAIAAEYANGYRLVFGTGVPLLARSARFIETWERDIVHLQLTLMAKQPDTLIARKCGATIAEESAARARRVLDAGAFDSPAGRAALADFDRWLRADGHRRNPGTTADLVTACLFAALQENPIMAPTDEAILAPWTSLLPASLPLPLAKGG